jgi:hypothetical protein
VSKTWSVVPDAVVPAVFAVVNAVVGLLAVKAAPNVMPGNAVPAVGAVIVTVVAFVLTAIAEPAD